MRSNEVEFVMSSIKLFDVEQVPTNLFFNLGQFVSSEVEQSDLRKVHVEDSPWDKAQFFVL